MTSKVNPLHWAGSENIPEFVIVLYNCFMEKAYNLSTKLCGMLHELLRVQRKEESEKIGVVQ